jgi:hypothetical protein
MSISNSRFSHYQLYMYYESLLQVTRHLSPFEQQIVMPWLKTFPKRAYAKFSDSGPYLVATAIIVYGTAAASDAADHAQDKSYRY